MARICDFHHENTGVAVAASYRVLNKSKSGVLMNAKDACAQDVIKAIRVMFEDFSNPPHVVEVEKA